MKNLLSLVCTFLFLSSSSLSQAADIRHTYGNSSQNSFYIDDKGGSVNNGGHNLSYYINFQEVDQSSRGTLLLYGNNATLGSKVDNGYVDDDFTQSSGIQSYPLSNLLGASFDGEIGLASNSPLSPVNFVGSQTGLRVFQVSYTSHEAGNNFIILEYRIFNPTTQSIHALIGLANDFDIDLKDLDALAAFTNSNSIPMVYQQDLPPNSPNNTVLGMALIGGTFSQFRIESCGAAFPYCPFFVSNNDATHIAFFEGLASQIGDLTSGASNLDFANVISADLGSIASERGVSAVFCYAVGNGGSALIALNALKTSALNCSNFYNSNLKICGNGIANLGEECDDGNLSNTDNCTSQCNLPVCGDGFVQPGNNEQCDNGASNSNSTPNACRTNCQLAHCGDGVTDSSEQCDDANSINTDNCISTCQLAKCGDGFVQHSIGEFCDDGNNVNGDGCSADCHSFESCGNNVLDPGESCDDGNNNTSDACPSGIHGTCEPAFCGDGFVRQNIEACDDGNNTNGDGCSANCESEAPTSTTPSSPPTPICGNGVVEASEECDDGNSADNDLCTSSCTTLSLQGGSSNSVNAAGGGSGGCALSFETTSSPSLLFVYLPLLALGAFLARKRKYLAYPIKMNLRNEKLP